MANVTALLEYNFTYHNANYTIYITLSGITILHNPTRLAMQ